MYDMTLLYLMKQRSEQVERNAGSARGCARPGPAAGAATRPRAGERR